MGLFYLKNQKIPNTLEISVTKFNKISNILQNLLAGNNDNFRSYLNNFSESLQKIKQQQDQQTIEVQSEKEQSTAQQMVSASDLANLFYEVSRGASLKTQEGSKIKYINEKWADKLKEHQDLQNQDPENIDQDCDRIYTKAYAVTLSKFKELIPQIKNIFENQVQPIESVIKMQAALTQIGLTQCNEIFMNNLLKQENLKQQISEVNNEDFLLLLEDLSFYKQSENKEFSQIYEVVFAEIGQRLQQGTNHTMMYFDEYLDSLEFLYVNYSIGDLISQNNEILKNLIQKCMEELKHYEYLLQIPSESQHKLYQLSQIVSIYPQLKTFCGDIFGVLGGLQGYQQFKSVSPVRERIVQYLNNNFPQQKELEQIELKSLPDVLQPDFISYKVVDGKLQRNGIYLLDSEYISCDEERIDGRIESWSQILQQKYNIKPHFIRYLTVQNDQLDVHNTQMIQKLVSPDPSIITSEFQSTVMKKIQSSQSDSVYLVEVQRIFDRIQILEKKSQGSVEIMALSALEEIKYSLYELSQIADMLSTQTLNTIASELKIKNFKEYLLDLSRKVNQHSSQNSQLQQTLDTYNFIGKRLTSDLISQGKKENQTTTSPINYLNYKQMTKKGYHDYEDWKELLKKELNIGNLMASDVNQVSGLFQSDSLTDNNDRISVIPNKTVDRFILRPFSYPLNWEAFYLEGNQQKQDKQRQLETVIVSENGKISKDAKFIANLQNFKYELRNSKHEKTIEMLSKFDFIEQLAQRHIELSQVEKTQQFTNTVSRDSEKYFESLEQNSVLSMYNSQYANFILKKAQKKQNIVSLWNQKNKGYLLQQYTLLQKGKISRNEFETIKQNINEELLAELKSFDQNSKEDVLLQGASRKYVDVNFNVSEFIKDKQGNTYSRLSDPDYLQAGEDSNKALDIKRFRAEQTMIQLAIIYKMEHNIPLKESEQNYAKKWVKGELKDGEFTFANIGTLSFNDKNLLKEMLYSDLTQFPSYSLNDFILEFSQLLNTSVIQDFNFKIIENELKQNWNINVDLLNAFQTSNVGNYWIQQAENIAWNEGQKLQQQDLQALQEMLAILRDKTPKQRKQLEKLKPQDEYSFNLFNESNSRLNLIEKYITQREQEMVDGVDVYSYKQKEDLKVQEIWEHIFESKYENTTQIQLNSFVDKFLQRIHLLSKFSPMSFSHFLIQLISHPQLHQIDREMLIAFLSVFEPELKLDTHDIIKLAQNKQLQKNQEQSIQAIKDKIKNASSFAYNKLFLKLQQL